MVGIMLETLQNKSAKNLVFQNYGFEISGILIEIQGYVSKY